MADYESMNENQKLQLLATIANLYYEHNMTQSQIAERMFISRSKVSRLLKEARAKNIVQITIKEPWERLLEVEAVLMEKFNLKDVRILNTKGMAYESMLYRLGEFSSYYIDGIIDKETILGMSWGKTIYHTVQSLKSTKNIPLTVVQIMGAASKDKPEIDAIDLTKQFAKAYGGKYYYLYAPIFVEDKAVKEMLVKDSSIADTLNLAKRSNLILTSLGPIDTNLSNAWKAYLNSYTQYTLQSKGAVGHLGGNFYDINGNKIDTELDEKYIGINLNDFLNVPNVIGIVGGEHKAKALLGALRGGFINTLIADDTIALRILELDGEM